MLTNLSGDVLTFELLIFPSFFYLSCLEDTPTQISGRRKEYCELL